MTNDQKIVTSLWFDGNAEEAVDFYCSVFDPSGIGEIVTYGEAGPGGAGSVLTISFDLAGQRFLAINGGPAFAFTPAISLSVRCASQAEIDHYWNRLLDGGAPQQCGWLSDRYGVSWQIVPKALAGMLGDRDRGRADRVMRAMLHMAKLDIDALRHAYDG